MTSTTYSIRAVEPQDRAAIARLWQALSDYHVQIDARMPAPVPGAADRYASRLIERRDDPHTCAFVAEVDNQVVGYILGAMLDLHPDLFKHLEAGYIADIFVDPAYRHQGIARDLVNTINRWFIDQGARYVEWQVAAANPGGLHFWESIGGKPLMIRMHLDIGGDSRAE
ncbi:MAG: GNAT family N-acetyltransferase [Anaerolineae bacterium]|jgi:GNAT superfamily N-acetyltransferase|nr:GNAT family N-acetyltransferase [Anaerolineae bacterium]